MIRYTFYFEEGHVATTVSNEDEDDRIQDFIDDHPGETLRCDGEKMDLYVSLDKVKCITREKVEAEAPVQTQTNETN